MRFHSISTDNEPKRATGQGATLSRMAETESFPFPEGWNNFGRGWTFRLPASTAA